jgi:DnaK suppressor protein
MTQTVKRQSRKPIAPAVRDLLQLRYDETLTLVEREDAAVHAMRTGLDEGPGDEVDHAMTRAQLDEQVTLATTLHSQLDDLASAIQRFEGGSYGVCENCHQPIPAERMELFPSATHCVSCKASMERR